MKRFMKRIFGSKPKQSKGFITIPNLKWSDVVINFDSTTWDKELEHNINDVITIFNGKAYILNNENFKTNSRKKFE